MGMKICLKDLEKVLLERGIIPTKKTDGDTLDFDDFLEVLASLKDTRTQNRF